ncbi:DUF5801 repeats-in-toxin domain-containing protein, partial [Bradyrhizobium sp. CCBAU 51627]|uniref:DUF5801 repeats-in-toxin domain-containing protein n=1 Tax=Bradyrhizobium sp. CCBAU 51627 TaxID=1325088 RepID=UPI00230609D6
SIQLSGTTVSLSVDESGLPTGSDSAHPAQTTDTEHFAGAFNSVAGADGASVTYTLAASGATSTVGVDSKLIDSATGNHVYLFLEGGQVVGREGTTAATAATTGPIVFTLSVVTSGASAGDVTLTQFRAIHENNTASNNELITLDTYVSNIVQLTATITDADGDHESVSLDLGHQVNFRDDGPTAGFTAGATTVSIDESAGLQQNDQGGAVPSLFPVGYGTPIQWAQSTASVIGSDTSSGGADGKASVSYALTGSGGAAISGVDSGIQATATGHEIFLFTENGLIVGREGTSGGLADAAGKVAFAIGLDGSNNLDVALYEALKQPNTSNPNDVDALTGKIYVTQSVTDGDGDVATSTSASALTVNFYDDGPTAIIPDMAVLINAAGKTFTGALDIDTNVDNNYGADGGTLKFASSLNNADSGLTSGGQHILYSVSADGHTLTGYLDTNGSQTFNAGDTTVFTIALNLDGNLNLSADTYTVTMSGTVDTSSTSIVFSTNTGFTFNGGNDPWADFIDSSSNHTDLLITPEHNGAPASTINSNAQVGGVGSGGSLGSGDSLRLDFVNNLTGTTAKTSGSNPGDYSNPVNEDHNFSHHYLVNGVVTTFSSVSDGEAKFVASTDHDTQLNSGGFGSVGNEATDYSLNSITKVMISYNGDTEFFDVTGYVPNTNHDVVVGGHTFTLQTAIGSGGETDVYVNHLVGGTVNNQGIPSSPTTEVGIFTQNEFNSLEISWAAGDTFKVGQFSTTTTNIVGQPVDISVPLTITDGDGDTATSGLNVYLMPSSPTTQDFSASASGVSKSATSTSPDIMGSTFDDTLSGDTGANILYGGTGNDTLNGGGGNDTLIGGAGTNTLTGGNGADKFVIQYVNGTEHDNITDFTPADGDQLYINIGAGFTLDTAPAVVTGFNFASGTDNNAGFASESATTNKFFLNTTSGDLFFSADGTAAHAIDLAHIGTGVPAANIHTV